MTKTINFINKNKSLIIGLMLCCIFAGGAFAQQTNNAITDWSTDSTGIAARLEILINILTSGWVRALIFLSFIVELIMLLLNKEQGGFKKILPIMIITIAIGAAPTIVQKFTSGYKSVNLTSLGISATSSQ